MARHCARPNCTCHERPVDEPCDYCDSRCSTREEPCSKQFYRRFDFPLGPLRIRGAVCNTYFSLHIGFEAEA